LGDLNSFQARFLALRQAIVADGLRKNLPFHMNDLLLLSERLASEGTSFVKVTLPLLGKALDQGLVSGCFSAIAHFRLKRNTRLPQFCYSLFRNIFADDGAILSEPCTDSIQFLRTFLLLDSKLYFEPTPIMKEDAVNEFAERMSSLRKVRIPTQHPVLLLAKSLIGRVLADLELSDIHPGHGPGAVAEKIDKFGRWDFTSWPSKAERYYPYIMYGTHSLRALLERGKGISMTYPCLTRCCLVPKDFKGPRLISAEHSVNQYLQQGQMKAIMKYVERHPILRRSIRLRDQTHNQKICERAYADGLVTLDLSNASDTVSVALVWYLFSEVPLLRNQLMSTRSDFMVYKDRKIKITSFSPMGSATCFPVETLVFWAIAMASLRLTSPSSGNYCLFDSELARDIAVFGDDIIVPDRALSTLLGTLISVGCSPNMSKTCFRTPFRESCGSEWFSGIDVSIIRNKKYQYGHSNFSDYPVLLDLQRKFFVRGYYETAELCRNWADKIHPVVTVSINRIIDSISPNSFPSRFSTSSLVERLEIMDFFKRNETSFDKYHCALGFYDGFTRPIKFRFNDHYQRYEFRIPVLFQKSLDWIQGGYPRLLARLLSDQTERIAIRGLKPKMAWSYLPVSPSFNGYY